MLLVVQSGVDVNSWHRVLLRSAKPVLHANVNCTPLIAAIVARQDVVVKYLLEVFEQLFCQPTQNMLIIMCLIELLGESHERKYGLNTELLMSYMTCIQTLV
jgi:hypothetical protein